MGKKISIKDILFTAAVVLLIIMFIKSCDGIKGFFGGGKSDTIRVKSDTVWMVTQGDTTYVPKPYTVTNTINRVIYKTDTLESIEVLPTDTAAIIERFYQKVFYTDTQTIKYGKVIIDDSVYRNRITSRRVITDIKVPEVTNTVTLREKRNVVYAGASVLSTLDAPLTAIGGDLSLKNKADKMYSIGAYATKEGKMYYSFGFKAPIRLIKRK